MTIPPDGDHSPGQTFGRSTNPDVDDRGPTSPVTEPGWARNPFGGRERGGAQGGELHPDGPGPLPADFMRADDIAGLPWTREPRDAWTSREVRSAVLALVRRFYRDHELVARRLIGWSVVEKATGNMAPERLPPSQQHLTLTFRYRVGESAEGRISASQMFGPCARTGVGLAQAIEAMRVAIEQQASVLG